MKKRTYANKSIEINDLQIESRKVSGYLAQFGIKDSQDDMFIKGCFAGHNLFKCKRGETISVRKCHNS